MRQVEVKRANLLEDRAHVPHYGEIDTVTCQRFQDTEKLSGGTAHRATSKWNERAPARRAIVLPESRKASNVSTLNQRRLDYGLEALGNSVVFEAEPMCASGEIIAATRA
jgi:hypothetical protein